MKVKALKFTKNHGFHGNGHFSRKKANFTENVTAVKSWIRLVPSNQVTWSKKYTNSFLHICSTEWCEPKQPVRDAVSNRPGLLLPVFTCIALSTLMRLSSGRRSDGMYKRTALTAVMSCNVTGTTCQQHRWNTGKLSIVVVIPGMQLLRSHSAIRRHHPPQRAVLSQICCFGECKVVLSSQVKSSNSLMKHWQTQYFTQFTK